MVLMIRRAAIFGAIVLVVGMVGDLRVLYSRASERSVFSGSCDYYQLRARSARRLRPGEFVVLLADACAAAQDALDTGTRTQRNRSEMLLSRIVTLRETIDRMNSERTISAAAQIAARLNTNVASGDTAKITAPIRLGMVNPVSPTGEFLIAHRLGVMLAYDAWLDSGVTFSPGADR
jgi:hypothetical protein